MQEIKSKQQAAQQVTLLGALLDLVLGTVKIIGGIISHSNALVVDGIHSLSDLATDALVIIVLKISAKEPDENHPWGHKRFETISTVMLGSMLVAIAGTIAYESLQLLSQQQRLIPEWPALLIVVFSILSKEWIFHRTLKIGKQNKSNLLISNAWHSRTDAYSSIVVLIGILGAMLGIWWLDIVAAIIVAIIIAKVGGKMIWDSVEELVDTALPQDKIDAYRKLIMQIDNIQSVQIKSRKMAGQSHLEMYLRIHLSLSSSEAHHIGHVAALRLQEAFNDIDHIVFHVDTCDPENEKLAKVLPLRDQINQTIKQALQAQTPPLPAPSRMILHYNQQVSVELFFKKHAVQTENLAAQLTATMGNPSWLKKIRIWEGNDA